MDLVETHIQKAAPAVHRSKQILEPDVHAIRVLWVDPDRQIIGTLAAAAIHGVAGARGCRPHGPGCPAVSGFEQPLVIRAHRDACVHGPIIGQGGLRECDVTERSRRRTIGWRKQVGRERDAAVRRAEDSRARHRCVDRRGRRGVRVDVSNEAIEDRLAVVEGRGVRAEVEASVGGAEEADVRRHQRHVRRGEHDAVDATIVEHAAGIEDDPGLASVDRLVDADALEEDPATVEDIARPRVDDGRIARVECHRSHGERQHGVCLGRPRHASVRALPDAAVVRRDIDHLVGGVPRVDGDVHHLP